MQRLVLTRDAAPETVPELATALGWKPARVPVGEQEDVRAAYLHATGVRVRWIDDAQTGWSYLLVPDAHAPAWRRVLRQSGALVQRGDALERFRKARDVDGIRDAALLLGLFAHGILDDEIFASLAAALLSFSDAVRSAALTAITYSTWSEFAPLLRVGLQESGASPAVLREGREIAEQMDAAQWNLAYYANDS